MTGIDRSVRCRSLQGRVIAEQNGRGGSGPGAAVGDFHMHLVALDTDAGRVGHQIRSSRRQQGPALISEGGDGQDGQQGEMGDEGPPDERLMPGKMGGMHDGEL